MVHLPNVKSRGACSVLFMSLLGFTTALPMWTGQNEAIQRASSVQSRQSSDGMSGPRKDSWSSTLLGAPEVHHTAAGSSTKGPNYPNYKHFKQEVRNALSHAESTTQDRLSQQHYSVHGLKEDLSEGSRNKRLRSTPSAGPEALATAQKNAKDKVEGLLTVLEQNVDAMYGDKPSPRRASSIYKQLDHLKTAQEMARIDPNNHKGNPGEYLEKLRQGANQDHQDVEAQHQSKKPTSKPFNQSP